MIDPENVPLAAFGPVDFYEMLREAQDELPADDVWRLELEAEFAARQAMAGV
jgi:hypothetical protein